MQEGVLRLSKHVADIVASSLYETQPVGVTEQPYFLNLVIEGETELGPRPLLYFVKSVERDVGRRPTFRWGPRVLDIDILMLGDGAVNEKDLVIPHRELANRAFVLVPLQEIAADLRIAGTQTTPRDLLKKLDDDSGITRLRPFQIPKRSSR